MIKVSIQFFIFFIRIASKRPYLVAWICVYHKKATLILPFLNQMRFNKVSFQSRITRITQKVAFCKSSWKKIEVQKMHAWIDHTAGLRHSMSNFFNVWEYVHYTLHFGLNPTFQLLRCLHFSRTFLFAAFLLLLDVKPFKIDYYD